MSVITSFRESLRPSAPETRIQLKTTACSPQPLNLRATSVLCVAYVHFLLCYISLLNEQYHSVSNIIAFKVNN
jgi:hypothetical protein